LNTKRNNMSESDEDESILTEQQLQEILTSKAYNIEKFEEYLLEQSKETIVTTTTTIENASLYQIHIEDTFQVNQLLDELNYNERKEEIEKDLKRIDEKRRMIQERQAREEEERKKREEEEERKKMDQEQEKQKREEEERKKIEMQKSLNIGRLHVEANSQQAIDSKATEDITQLLQKRKSESEYVLDFEEENENTSGSMLDGNIEKIQNREQIEHVRSDFIKLENGPKLYDIVKKYGRVLVLRICQAYYAIGTSFGLILLISRHERAQWLLDINQTISNNELSAQVNQYNEVTSIDLTASGDYILAGYKRGEIVLWETRSKSFVKRFTVSRLLAESSSKLKNLPSYSIVDVNFLHEKTQFLVSCCNVLFMITLNKKLFTTSYDVKLISSSMLKIGSIRHVNVLESGLALHPTNELLLVAVATDSQVLVINLKSTQILYQVPRPAETSSMSLPYLSWCRVLPPLYISEGMQEEIKGKNPHLAIAWGNVINVFQLYVYKDAKNTLEMNIVSNMQIPNEIIGICWLEERILAFIDSSYQVTIADPFAQASVQSVSIKDINIVYHYIFNESNMEMEGRIDNERNRVSNIRSYHHSYVENSGMLYLLGSGSMIGLTELENMS
jgi:hypothetical protein